MIRRECDLLKFIHDIDAVFIRKFMEKTPRTSGTHLVHVKIKGIRVCYINVL